MASQTKNQALRFPQMIPGELADPTAIQNYATDLDTKYTAQYTNNANALRLRPAGRLLRLASQSYAAGVTQNISFDNVFDDTAGFANLVTAPDRITVSAGNAGVYWVTIVCGSTNMPGTATSQLMWLAKNGIADIRATRKVSKNSSFIGCWGYFELAVADNVQFPYVFTGTGTANPSLFLATFYKISDT